MEFAGQPLANGFSGSPGLGWRPANGHKPAVASGSTFPQDQTDHRVYNIDDGHMAGAVDPSGWQSQAWHLNVPLLGRIRILKDKAGLLASSIIVLYWAYGNWSTWFAILLPRYFGDQLPFVLMLMYACVSILCITSFVRVSTMNPGSLSANLQPQEDWNVCQRCLLHRPSDTHHCRRCGHCVRKMDHHCPWINNCVGEENQFAFMLLLFYAYCLSIMTLTLDLMHMCFMPPCLACDQESFVTIHQSAIMWIAVVMAIMMTCGAFSLYFGQHVSILFETPSMEWARIQQEMFLLGKAPEKWPTQKEPVLQVYRTVCGPGPHLFWLFPCRRVRSKSLLRSQIYV